MHDKVLRFVKDQFGENEGELNDFLTNFTRDNVDFRHLLEARKNQPRKDFFAKRKLN